MTLTGGPHLQVRQREEWRVGWLGRLGRLGRLGLREKEKRGEEEKGNIVGWAGRRKESLFVVCFFKTQTPLE